MPVLPARYVTYALCLLGFAACLGGLSIAPAWGWGVGALAFGLLAALGTRDLLQRRHTVSRNYPITAHFRYLLESFGPEIRQYFIQRDTEEVPFSREQRSLVYRRAKATIDKKPFGSLRDMQATGYEWMNHSLAPAQIADDDFRVQVGAGRPRPYAVSVFNISAMSFGALSPHAISALNDGARRGGFYHDTGEGGISPYHLRGGDLVWEIGSGYFGCRDASGRFDSARFAEQATLDAVKMIEIKLSQGAKPGHGGILPGAKVTAEIARIRNVPEGRDVISPAAHSAFATPRELIGFLRQLRERVRIGAAGKVIGAFDIARILALGADWCNAARGFMFALGCIQAQSCHTDRCPSGVATQDRWRGDRLDIPLKAERVQRYQASTRRALAEMLAAAGLTHPRELGPEHVMHRVSRHAVKSFDTLYDFLAPNALLQGCASHHAVFRDYWNLADPDRFVPPETLIRLRASKLV